MDQRCQSGGMTSQLVSGPKPSKTHQISSFSSYSSVFIPGLLPRSPKTVPIIHQERTMATMRAVLQPRDMIKSAKRWLNNTRKTLWSIAAAGGSAHGASSSLSEWNIYEDALGNAAEIAAQCCLHVSVLCPARRKNVRIYAFYFFPLMAKTRPYNRRKFKKQTSDNMGKRKSRGGKSQRGEEKKREDQRGQRMRRQKMQARENLGKSRFTVFFPMICGSGGSKSSLAKAAGAEPSGQMRDEKLHAVVARSTFPSQNVKNTTCSDHFWKSRCRKKMKKVHAGVARSTFRSQKCKKLRAGHFFKSEPKWDGRCQGWCTFSKWAKTRWLCSSFNYNYNYNTRHYTTLCHTTKHSTTLHYTTLHYTTLHYTTLHYTPLHYTTLHYTTLHPTTLHYTTLHYTPLHYT